MTTTTSPSTAAASRACTFRVGLSADLRPPAGSDLPTSWGDIGLDALVAAGAELTFLEPDDGVLTAAHVDGYDAVLFAAPGITAETVSGPNPPRHLARFGVGLDAVDVEACTRAGVAVTITPDGARRAVATAALTLVLSVLQNVAAKDAVVRHGDWSDRLSLMGRGLTGLTVMTIGLGNVAGELFGLLAPFGTTNLAFDPHRPPHTLGDLDVSLVDLEDGLRRADVVVVTAALTPETHHLLDAARLALLPRGAVVVNVARGPIVETDALVEALRSGHLGGAGLDVFEVEPLPADHPLTSLPRVVLTPHAIAWTTEMARSNGDSCVRAILAVREGRTPDFLADRSVVVRAPR